jgi:hypothetical protein
MANLLSAISSINLQPFTAFAMSYELSALICLSLLAFSPHGLQTFCYELSAMSFLSVLSQLPTFSPSQLLCLASQLSSASVCLCLPALWKARPVKSF